LFAVALVCKELGRIGKMTPEQAKKYDAEKETKKTEKIILSALTTAVLLNIKDLPKTYTSLFDEWHKGNEYMYKYRGVPFVDVADNKGLQKIINAYSKKSGAELLDLTKTKAIKVLDANENPVTLRKQILKSFDDASKLVIEGKTDFYSAMRKSVLDLGGSGARVEYPNGMTRRLDTVVRQNMLYNAKMSSREYNEQIGKELGCDGIEVSFSANPRPTHRFMEGRQFCNGKSKEINGIHFDGAEDTRDAESGQNVIESLDDYNCNHRETPIICGVSEPAYSPEELARLKAENERQFTIGNSTGDGYYWSQRMRSLETATRKAKGEINGLEALGDAESKAKAKELRKQIKAYRAKYNEICDTTGIKPDYRRMGIVK
jgi:hypothetical protein